MTKRPALLFLAVFLFLSTSGLLRAESVYDRVMRTGTIRVGYLTSPPGVIRDPNTGAMAGIAVEALNRAAANLSLKVDYVEETQWGTMIEGLATGRYDVAMMVWGNAARARLADFSIPLFYSAVNAYVRPDDRRFDHGLEAGLRDPAVRIATVDGDVTESIALSRFPEVKRVELPQNADVAQLMLAVTTRKADVNFEEAASARYFTDHNPGSLKNATPDKPVGICGNVLVFKRGEFEFERMLDHALEEQIDLGFVDRLIKKYEPFPGALYPAALPYRKP
jgi:ABC-type amino acid transport substrate-binding protein